MMRLFARKVDIVKGTDLKNCNILIIIDLIFLRLMSNII
jgi:hypothetical protein